MLEGGPRQADSRGWAPQQLTTPWNHLKNQVFKLPQKIKKLKKKIMPKFIALCGFM